MSQAERGRVFSLPLSPLSKLWKTRNRTALRAEVFCFVCRPVLHGSYLRVLTCPDLRNTSSPSGKAARLPSMSFLDRLRALRSAELQGRDEEQAASPNKEQDLREAAGKLRQPGGACTSGKVVIAWRGELVAAPARKWRVICFLLNGMQNRSLINFREIRDDHDERSV
jgi:hypothetical protein